VLQGFPDMTEISLNKNNKINVTTQQQLLPGAKV
jgi:hypothetical protein